MKPTDEFDTLMVLLTALALRKGGKITLPQREILACSERYNLAVEEDRQGQNVTIEVREVGLRLFRPAHEPTRRRLSHRGEANRPAENRSEADGRVRRLA